MVPPDPIDPTPYVASPTDIAPEGRGVPTPAHEHTAGEDLTDVDWEKIAARDDFRGLLKRKAAFIVPASVFFIVYYFALPALVGYAKPLMITRVGPVNLAYLFALSQFFMAWIIAALYVRAATIFDRDARSILENIPRR
jgi:uncharacterized membrane protein (DUF485 family)